MEQLTRELDDLLKKLKNEVEVRGQLQNLVSIYPFNKYEYIISNLLSSGVLSLEDYQTLRKEYNARNPHLHVFDINAPRTFGEAWAQGHVHHLIPSLEKPTKQLDPEYSGQYDFFLDGIRIEVKASRGVDSTPISTAMELRLTDKALSSDSKKPFWMNFQQLKPTCCDVFIWLAVWRDVIWYWVFASKEVESNQYYSPSQHRGSDGEGQLHLKQDNIAQFNNYRVNPENLENAVRLAKNRQDNQRT